MHKTSVQYFYDFFCNADSVRVVSSSNGSGQSHTEYISCNFEAMFLPRFAKQERGCGVPNVLLIQLEGLGERCKLPHRVWAEPSR